MRRDAIDFHAVRDEHLAIHDLLCNWSRVVRDNITSGGNCTPMFRHYRTANYRFDLEDPGLSLSRGAWVDDAPRNPPPDRLAGWKMEKAVGNLPEKERYAVRWAYVFTKRTPAKAAYEVAVTQTVLGQLVHNARSMLKNRT